MPEKCHPIFGRKAIIISDVAHMGSPLSKLAHGLFFILQPEHNSTELRCV
jgi:hypothetical protein